MGRVRRETAVVEASVSVLGAPAGDPVEVDFGDGAEEDGVVVPWQSEEVKIEAAEFLVATRIQQAARIRAAHDLEQRRRPGPAVPSRPPD